ncbi:MAG TPA: hypothetical protein VHE81_07470, partial [Lacipirellulaceae bacterium]|nr:hypothetical protein [Lacipirellulaceae bacterium]
MKRYFFTPSLDAQTQLSAFFQFFWTAASAMWNLRWQVQGFSSAYPGCSESDLQQRFVLGSEIHGASLKRTCIENTWDQNRGTFGQFLLFQSFGIYESWIADI